MSLNDQPQSLADQTDPASFSLESLEVIIARGLPNLESIASALLQIHDRKLYRERYRSFKVYLCERWQMSRSRGYQLVHFARIKKMSTTVDTIGPQNERQARRLDAKGEIHQPEEPDPIMEAMEYVYEVFQQLPEHEKPELILHMRDVLTDLQRKLDRQIVEGEGGLGRRVDLKMKICKTNPTTTQRRRVQAEN